MKNIVFGFLLLCVFLGKSIDVGNKRIILFESYPKDFIYHNNELSLELFNIDISTHNLIYEQDPLSKVKHYTIQQHIEGFPVFGRYVKVHFSDQNLNASISIDFFEGNYNKLVLLSKQQAIKIIKENFNSSEVQFKNINKIILRIKFSKLDLTNESKCDLNEKTN